MEIVGVPDSVPYERVLEFLRGIGIDLEQVARDKDGRAFVSIGWDCVSCTVFAVNADGHQYVDRATDSVATHDVRIPCVHADVPSASTA